ncbi:conserved hypothetical protein [Coccidioides posadasii str. Silveira]|uniref:Uncharacterized protein n=1 Tax=Coccidioides posadasii (strain RMSCC 757 / Silveira) TaxID=443226 RepID=E9DC24_COCPS|nr:conserved hypothetical protein [Coccidioides posadasii str. Silveira]
MAPRTQKSAAQDEHSFSLVSEKKKPGRKPSALKEEPTMGNTVCSCCLMFMYTAHIDKPCCCKQEIAKICTNYTEDKKASVLEKLVPIQAEQKKLVEYIFYSVKID